MWPSWTTERRQSPGETGSGKRVAIVEKNPALPVQQESSEWQGAFTLVDPAAGARPLASMFKVSR